MTDTATLRREIENHGYKYKFLAKQLGLSAYGLQKKIDNVNEFKVSEVYKLSEILSLTSLQRDSIFFAKEVDLKSTNV